MRNSSTCRNFRRKTRGETGGTLVELAMVIPVMLLIMAGVMSLGQIINQDSWLNQVAFQSYLAGAEIWDTDARQSAMQARALALRNSTIATSNTPIKFDQSSFSDTVTANAGLNTVSSEIAANFSTVLGPISVLSLKKKVTGPILATAPTTVAALTNFQNGFQTFDCNSTPGTSSPVRCVTTACSPTSCPCDPNPNRVCGG